MMIIMTLTKCSKAHRLIGVVLAVLLSACVSQDFSELESYISEVKSKKSSRVEPLPPIKPYETFLYAATGLRDPFEPFFKKKKPDVDIGEKTEGGLTPDTCGTGRRNCEELEQFPLDSMRMVGTMANEGNYWGIVLSSDGTIFRVSVGDYVGQNYGKIFDIREDSISVREIVPDGLGGWQERQASLALTE